MDTPYPTNVQQSGEDSLRIEWSDGHVSLYKVRDLRLACRCAGCQDEQTGERTLDQSKIPADVHPKMINPVGRYALHFDWSDGHTTGIYTFEHLLEVCPCQECLPRGKK